MIKDNIPFEIKEKILDLAQKLPEVLRSQFVKNTTIRIKDLAQEHPKYCYIWHSRLCDWNGYR